MISVVVPARDRTETLERCLVAVSSQQGLDEPVEILVVDDGSEDGTGEAARQAGVRVLKQSASGAAAARNYGIREAQGEIIAFTDADCVPDPEWLSQLTRSIRHGQVGACVGRCGSDQKHWVAALIQIELDERYDLMAHHSEIDFLNTGNCAFRRELLENKGFDESFQWLEDVELSYRLAHNGKKMVFVPDARVTHPHTESFWAYLKRKFHYASYAPAIYRRYPEKLARDSRTPLNRKAQLVALALAAPTLLVGRWLALSLVVFSVACSFPVIWRAFQRSVKLGLLAPFFVLAGNVAFVCGTLVGFVREAAHRDHRVRTE